MKKPIWIRLVGVLGWVMAALGALGFYHFGQGDKTPHLALITIAFCLGALLAFGVWGVGSAVVWVVRKQAAATGVIIRDVAREPRPAPDSRALVPWAGVYCVVHHCYVPWAAVGQHDERECLYIPDTPLRDIAHLRSQRTPQKPLEVPGPER